MKRLIKNLNQMSRQAFSFFSIGLLLTNLLLLAALLLYLTAGPLTVGSAAAWAKGDTLLRTGAVILLISGCGAAMVNGKSGR